MTRETDNASSTIERAWRTAREHPWRTAVYGLVGLILVAILFFALFPSSAPPFTGFADQPHPNGWIIIPYRTLWDWMELLLVPLLIGIAAHYFSRRQQARQFAEQERIAEMAEQGRQNERAIAQDAAEQEELESYYENIGDLLLDYGLGGEDEAPKARALARARTLIALAAISGERKGLLLRFLYEAGLIDAPEPVVDLFGADLDDLVLRFADLRGASLAGVSLRDASLIGSDLSSADLSKAQLNRASLRCAVLAGVTATGARFSGASLHDADLRDADLSEATFSLADAPSVDLREAVLDAAVLEGVDLGRALLHGADLGTAVLAHGGEAHPLVLAEARYDEDTRWPQGFAVDQAQAVLGPAPTEQDSRCRDLAKQYRREA